MRRITFDDFRVTPKKRSDTYKFYTGALYEVDYASGKHTFILPTIPIHKQNLFGFMVITDKNRDLISDIEDDDAINLHTIMPISLPDGTNGCIDLLNIHVLSFDDMCKAPIIGAIGNGYDPITMKIIPRPVIMRYIKDKYKLAVGCHGCYDIELKMPSVHIVPIDVNSEVHAGFGINSILKTVIDKCYDEAGTHVCPPLDPPITNDNGVIKCDGVRISSMLDRYIRTWPDTDIGYFLYRYSDSNNRDAMAKGLGLSSDELEDKYIEVRGEYRRRKRKNLWGFINYF